MICDFLDPGETVPSIYVPSPLNTVYSEEAMKEQVLKENPDILHCHHDRLLDNVLSIGKQCHLPVVFSVYRYAPKSFFTSKDLFSNKGNQVAAIFVPNSKTKQTVHDLSPEYPVQILKESLESHYFFKEQPSTPSTEKKIFNFAVLISELDEKYIETIHHSLEKILITNHVLSLSWVCFDSKIKKYLQKHILGKTYARYVSITDLTDFPLLNYDGLITDGNKNKMYSPSQYFFLLMSVIKEGKLLITEPIPDLEDILVDGETCLVVEDYHSTKVSHLIHFLISFPEEMLNLSRKASHHYQENHSFKSMGPRLREAYSKILM